MRDGYFCAGSGGIEHVENDRFGAPVLAAVDGADDLYHRFAGVESAFCTVRTDDGQFTLLDNTVVDDGMVVPIGLGAGRKDQTFDNQFGFAGRVGREGLLRPSFGMRGAVQWFGCP